MYIYMQLYFFFFPEVLRARQSTAIIVEPSCVPWVLFKRCGFCAVNYVKVSHIISGFMLSQNVLYEASTQSCESAILKASLVPLSCAMEHLHSYNYSDIGEKQ